jgi:erythromycin esterase
MKIRLFIVCITIAAISLKVNKCYSQTIDTSNSQTIIDWLKKTSIPLQSVNAHDGLNDLLPLKEILKNVSTVGLGEATHGTSEFFLFKHKMIEFLVKELDFRCFTIESSFSACQNINDYVRYGRGDLAISLASQGYSPWDTWEMTDLIKWMRAYNSSVADNKKVQFLGVDINYNAVGRAKVKAYFRKYAQSLAKLSDSIFRVCDGQDEKWPFVDSKDSVLYKAVPVLQHIIDRMKAQKEALVHASSAELFEQNLKLLQEAKNGAEVNSQRNSGGNLRDKYMADNIEYVRNKISDNGKIIFWAHNDHIEFDPADSATGSYLKNKYGSAYYAVGFTFHEGSYLGRDSVATNVFGPRKELPAVPGPAYSLGWYLNQTGFKYSFVNLVNHSNDPGVNEWLGKPVVMRDCRWVRRIWENGFDNYELTKCFDGIFYSEQSHPSKPTGTIVKMNRL